MNFHGIDYFVDFHLTQASPIDCDHMHDGLGFFTQVCTLIQKH
jgi:hypothetical protein